MNPLSARVLGVDSGALNGSTLYERLSRPRGREESPMKRVRRKRSRLEEVVAKLGAG